MLKQNMDKLISTIARDAIDGSEVWKTIAFTLLGCLVYFSSSPLSSLSSNVAAVGSGTHNLLSRYALLSSFVSSPVLLDLLNLPPVTQTEMMAAIRILMLSMCMKRK